MGGNLVVVVGGQYGSEGKGAVAGWLSAHNRELLAMRVAGPNAGHTVLDQDGRAWKLRCVPVAAVTNPEARLAIAAGSEVDMTVLNEEVQALDAANFHVSSRLVVDQSATLLTEEHRFSETDAKLVERIGSTGKGIGAARAERIMRRASLFGGGRDIALTARHWLNNDGTVLVEGAQGFGLGLHGEFYPHCTSSDCRAIDFLSMAGISPWDQAVKWLEVWVVLRTRPIRVAGQSGPMHNETTWEQLEAQSGGHIQPETTTVTGKIRRVGEWDQGLAQRALAANGGVDSRAVRVALTFLDYDVPDVAGLWGHELLNNPVARAQIEYYEDQIGRRIDMVGTGPDSFTWRA